MRDEDVNKFHFKKVLTHIFIDHQLTKNTTSVLLHPDGKQGFFSISKRGKLFPSHKPKLFKILREILKKITHLDYN